MERGELYSCFGLLSYEMVIDVFDYLTHRDRKNCRIVYHRWRILLDNCGKYFVFSSTLDNKDQQLFFNSYRIMNFATMKNCTKPVPRSASFPTIRHAMLGWRNGQKNIITFLKSAAENCHSITITKFSLGEINLDLFTRNFGRNIWGNLNGVSIRVILTKYKFERAARHLDAVCIFFKLAKIPNLRNLDFYFSHQYEQHRSSERRAIRFQKLCLAFYEFVATHAKTLKDIKCSIFTTRRPSRWFSIPEIPDKLKDSYLEDLKLKNCYLKFWGVSQLEAIVTPTFFGSKLEYFRVALCKDDEACFSSKGVAGNLITLNQNLSQIFTNNGKSLSSVLLINFEHVNPTWFENCCALVYISVDITPDQDQFNMPSEIGHSLSFKDAFLSSANTLLYVEIFSLPHLDLSCLRHCQKLETVLLCNVQGIGREIEEQRLEKQNFHKTNSLKELRLYLQRGNVECVGEIQELLNRNGKSLEKLNIRGETQIFQTVSLNLSECRALKTLEILGAPTGYMANAPVSNFPNLTSFCAAILEHYPNAKQELIEWISRTMPNVKAIGYLYSDPDDISIIQKLLKIAKVVKIFWSPVVKVVPDEVSQFCSQNPGIEIRIDENEIRKAKVWCIFVDRLVYRNNN